MVTEAQAKQICEKLLRYVKADDAQVSVSSSSNSHLRFANNSITTNGRSVNTSANIVVWINQKKGSATTNEMDDASLRAAVEQAEQFARLSPVDPEYLPSLGPQTYQRVNAYVAATADIAAAARARAIADVIDICDKSKVLGYGFHESSGWAEASATKNGNFRFDQTSNVAFSLTVRTPDGGGSGYFFRDHFDVAKLDLLRVAREAVRKALESHDPQPLSPGTYSVILEPQAVADLLSYFSYDFDARRADEGRSPFSAPGGKTKLGEKVFDERVNIYSEPANRDIPRPAATWEGIPAQKIWMVRSGVVETLNYRRFWAKKKNMQPTPGPVNTILEGSGSRTTIEAMIKATERGLLVSRFWYIRPTDPRTAAYTGLTRDGLWSIENGKVHRPVRNFRFNQSLLEMLAPGNIAGFGVPERIGSSSLMPALQLKQFHFTSESDAV